MKALINGIVITEKEALNDVVVVVEDEKITSICSKKDFASNEYDIIDLQGCYLMPGFIDTHIHGSKGMDVMDATSQSLIGIGQSLLQTGVTAFLGTTMTQSKEDIFAALDCIRAHQEVPETGARILGAHLEGPFILAKAKGAHLEHFIEKPKIEWINTYEDVIKIVTLAPEVEGAKEFTGQCCGKGVVVSMGHSACTYNEAMHLIEHGAKSVTHLFNAMSGLHHREPGLVGAALTSTVYTELIADTVHCRPELFPMIIQVKGPDKIILITDAMKGQCMAPGRYDLGGQTVIVDESSARLENGTLAGSILTQSKSLKHMMQFGGVTLVEAAKMLSTNAADLIGRSDLGRIAVGCHADFVVIDDHLDIQSVYIRGMRVVGGES